LAGRSVHRAYVEWTVAPNPSYVVDYTSATLDYTIGTNPTFTHEIRTSLDGYTGAIASHTTNAGSTVYSDPLTVLGIRTDPVTFRLYGQVDAASGASGFYNSSMSITAPDGAVYAAVPEPASLSLVAGLLSMGLVLRRLRRA
jgi:hypothetical protein